MTKLTGSEQLVTDSYISFVNMDHRKDRLNHMDKQLFRIGLHAERTRGMRPEEYSGQWNVAVMRRRTPGAIGCHMSQLSIIIKARALQKHAWVMEDDIIFCSDIPERLEIMQNWMNENEWDVFWLGSSFHVKPPYWHRKGPSGMSPDCSANLGYDAKLTSNPRIVRTFGAFCTFAYIVNNKSIDKIITLFDQYTHESIGIDWLFIKLQPRLKCFSFVPGLVMQMDNISDIGDGDTIWSGMLKLNGTFENSAYVFQDKMEDFDPLKFNWAEAR